jgi:hypothetical protein
MTHVKENLKNIRSVLDKHLKEASKELGADISIGNFGYQQDEDGNIANFTTKLNYVVGGKTKEYRALENIVKDLKSEGLVDKKVSIKKRLTAGGRDIKALGWKHSAPKRPFIFEEDGEEYVGSASILGRALGMSTKDMEDHFLFWQDFPKNRLTLHGGK